MTAAKTKTTMPEGRQDCSRVGLGFRTHFSPQFPNPGRTPRISPGPLKARLRNACRQSPTPRVAITKGSRRKKDRCRECRQDRSKHACGTLILSSVVLSTLALARGSRRKREGRGKNRTDAKMSSGSSKPACHNALVNPPKVESRRTTAKTTMNNVATRFGFSPQAMRS